MTTKFWNNLNSNLHAAERKLKNTAHDVVKHIPDNIIRKTNNTLKKVNQSAIPLLGVITAYQPELAPFTGAISAGLVGAEALSSDLKVYDGSINRHKSHFI